MWNKIHLKIAYHYVMMTTKKSIDKLLQFQNLFGISWLAMEHWEVSSLDYAKSYSYEMIHIIIDSETKNKIVGITSLSQFLAFGIKISLFTSWKIPELVLRFVFS